MKKVLSILTALILVISCCFAVPLSISAAGANTEHYYQFEDGTTCFSAGSIVADPLDSANHAFKFSTGDPYIGWGNTVSKSGYYQFDAYFSALPTSTLTVRQRYGSWKGYINIDTNGNVVKSAKTVGTVAVGKWYTFRIYYDIDTSVCILKFGEKGGTLSTYRDTYVFDGTTAGAFQFSSGAPLTGLYVDNVKVVFTPAFAGTVSQLSSVPALKAALENAAEDTAFVYPAAYLNAAESYQNAALALLLNRDYTSMDGFTAALSDAITRVNPYSTSMNARFDTSSDIDGLTPNGAQNTATVADGIMTLNANSAFYRLMANAVRGTAIISTDYRLNEYPLAGFNIFAFRDTTIAEKPWVYLSSNATGTVKNTTVSGGYSLEKGVWYNLKMVLNFDTKRYNIYAKTNTQTDYTLIAESALNNQSAISVLYIYSPTDQTASFDNVKVEQYNYIYSSEKYTVTDAAITGIAATDTAAEVIGGIHTDDELTASVVESNQQTAVGSYQYVTNGMYLKIAADTARVKYIPLSVGTEYNPYRVESFTDYSAGSTGFVIQGSGDKENGYAHLHDGGSLLQVYEKGITDRLLLSYDMKLEQLPIASISTVGLRFNPTKQRYDPLFINENGDFVIGGKTVAGVVSVGNWYSILVDTNIESGKIDIYCGLKGETPSLIHSYTNTSKFSYIDVLYLMSGNSMVVNYDNILVRSFDKYAVTGIQSLCGEDVLEENTFAAGSMSFQLSVANNTGNVKGCTAIAALYKDNELVSANSVPAECAVGESTITLPFTVSSTENSTVKVFVLEDLQNVKPLEKAIELVPAQ